MVEDPSKTQDPIEDRTRNKNNITQLAMTLCGAALVIVGGFCLVYAVWIVVGAQAPDTNVQNFLEYEMSPVMAFFLAHNDAMMLLIAGIGAGLVGTNLMGKSISINAQTIAERDRRLLEPLIENANEEAISQYVRISSLTGLTGFFTKLGFTGLPLATAGLGVLLIFLAILEDSTISTDLMDLAKLVIGAFIGSFVQRKVGKSGSTLPEDNL